MDPSGNSSGGETPPSSPNQTQLHWPGQTHVTANNEPHIINEPSLPLPNAGGRRAPPSPPRPLEIEEPRQPPLGANQESHIINKQIPPPHHAANGSGTQPSPSSQIRHENLEQSLKDTILQLQQQILRLDHDFFGAKTYSEAFEIKLLRNELEDKYLQFQRDPRVHQESKPSSSSEDRRGGVVARSCANCNNTSTTQWRSDPTGQKSLCNACGIRLNNREEETRAASGLQSSNVVSPPPEMSPTAAPSLANRVQLVENISGLQSSPPLRDPPEEASETEELWQSWINKSPDNSPVCKRAKMEEPPAVPLPDPSEVASNMEEFSQSLTDRTPDNNPFVPENNFLRHSSGLQSSNVVSPPPEMSPPAAPSLSNRVQHLENISGLQSSPPLRDTPEEASETEEFWQSWINKSPDNSPGA
ncbi:hypothetical protein QN277_025908 [Acacia crassicarpa]|uniref:GATA-type domain-containing protein n=1 Tax=Acacia crassicarpa TaxID=499986 RepID=A0AAE1JA63_9FABA|nr:hypothetical protein QN277_025908 [Acacia crassicarpa]